MDSLTTHWNRTWGTEPERRLHWYVLPPSSCWGVVERADEAIARDELRPVPPSWLHCTVVSVANTVDVNVDDREALLAAGRSAVQDLAPFDTTPGRPAVWGEAVVYDLSPSDTFSVLWQRVLDASTPFLSGPRPERYVPHVTFSYAHAPGDATPTKQALVDPALVLPSFRVDTVWLLDVLREPGPEKGWYSWDVVGAAHLRG